tara:strand:- start:4097 stop:5248 length:1152 start_codon:yes stop_codon:yes gene_type:complete
MIRLAEQIIDLDDVNSMRMWLSETERYTKGKETKKFEEQWSDWLGTRYSVFVNSGSSANLLLFLSLIHSEKLKNKKVIIPAVSWVTTVSPSMQLGLEPILCDCDKEDLGLNIEDFENLCKEHNPAAVMLVHVLGHSNKMKEVREICEKYDVLLLEDTCEAYGSSLNNKKLGTFGLASTHSFFYGHAMSTIEGGMISTDDSELYNIMVSIRSHGWLRDNEEHFREKFVKKYNISDFDKKYFFVYPGLNVRNTDLNAFLGQKQIEKIDSFVENRNKNYIRFCENLKGKIRFVSSETSPVSALAFGLIHENRNKIVKALEKNNIECRPLICGSIQEHPFWYNSYEKRDLPNAKQVHDHGFYVPCHQNMTEQQVDFISDIILDNLER